MHQVGSILEVCHVNCKLSCEYEMYQILSDTVLCHDYDMLYSWNFLGVVIVMQAFQTHCATESLQVTGPDGDGVGLVLRSSGIALPQPEETQGLSQRCHGAMALLNGRIGPWPSLASSDSPHFSLAEITARKASALGLNQLTLGS